MAGPDFFQTVMGKMFYEATLPRIAKALERIAKVLEDDKEPHKEPEGRPVFNHTRGDGPFDPCPICIELMSREQLLALVKDLKGCNEDLEREKREREG